MSSNNLEAKIVVLGAQGVGKTSLLNRYIHQSFSATGIPSTVGASFLTKRLSNTPDHPDTTIRLQIWDTAGQERFRSITKLFYRGANAAILCYDITDERSFLEMGSWLDELRAVLGEDIILHVVGTKADVVADAPEKRQVSFERCIMYVAEHVCGAPPQTPSGVGGGGGWSSNRSAAGGFSGSAETSKRSSGVWGQDMGWDCCHEISAKDGEGVEEVFRVIARKLVEQRRVMDEKEAAEPARSAGLNGRDTYFDSKSTGGSFRIGIGDKRRSWLGFPGFPVSPNSPTSPAAQDETRATEAKRHGRCC